MSLESSEVYIFLDVWCPGIIINYMCTEHKILWKAARRIPFSKRSPSKLFCIVSVILVKHSDSTSSLVCLQLPGICHGRFSI